MKLWEHPRLTGALCAAAVLACAAMLKMWQAQHLAHS